MTVVDYLARHHYRSWINGRPFAVRAGDVFHLDLADIGALVRDCPGLADWTAPLTPAQAAQARAEAEQRDRDRADRETARETALRAHVRQHGGAVCPLCGPVWRLDAVPDGAGWRVACPACLAIP